MNEEDNPPAQAAQPQPAQPAQQPPPFKAWDADKKITFYKAYLDVWDKTTAERTDYNNTYQKLLFTDTLVAVAVGVLTGSSLHISGLTFLLFALVFGTGMAISFVWYCKLKVLWIKYGAERDAIILLEEDLEMPKAAQKIYTERKADEDKSRVNKLATNANYYGLPAIFTVVFFIAFLVFAYYSVFSLLNPSIIPFIPGVGCSTQNATATLHTTLNATLNTSALVS